MVSRLLTKLVLVVAAVSQIAISSPAHAAKSPKTIAVEQQMESKLLSLQQKIKEGKPVTKEEGRELTRLLHDYLVKLAGDIDRDLKAGRFADADKEIKEFAKESKFLEKLGNPFLSDPLKFKQLSDAELIVVASAFVRVKSMVASIEAAQLLKKEDTVKQKQFYFLSFNECLVPFMI
jgi:hypothetical protein